MKLYGHPMSTCTRKVLTTLAEKGVKAEFVTIDIMTGANKNPEYLAKQPFGQVPVIEDGSLRVYESRAIIRYLDEVLPGVSLTPKDAKGRAEMEQWISVETSNFTPHAMALLYQLFFGPMRGQQPDPVKVEEAKVKLAKCADVLDAQLATGPFILGDGFTLADICYMPYIEYLVQTPAADVLTSRKNVNTWWNRIRERASWKTALGKA